MQDTSNVNRNALFYKHYGGIRYTVSRRRCFCKRQGGEGARGGERRDKIGVVGVWLIDKQAGASHIQKYIRA